MPTPTLPARPRPAGRIPLRIVLCGPCCTVREVRVDGIVREVLQARGPVAVGTGPPAPGPAPPLYSNWRVGGSTACPDIDLPDERHVFMGGSRGKELQVRGVVVFWGGEGGFAQWQG